MGLKRMENRVAIVTGSGSGIGRATAILLAEEGASVVVADLAEDIASETVKMITDSGGKAVVSICDVTKSEDASKTVNLAVKTFGRLDILVNNVGGSRPGHTIVEMPEEDWDFYIDLNLKSQFLMCKYAVPRIADTGGGAIINISSGAGVFGMPRNAAYCAAKGGVISFTKALAVDHAPQNIRANCIAPGTVLTPLMERNRTPEEIKRIAKMNVLRRLADPRDLAQAVVFLASDEASFITGQAVNVDGGSGIITGI